jgi:hypothetical protein
MDCNIHEKTARAFGRRGRFFRGNFRIVLTATYTQPVGQELSGSTGGTFRDAMKALPAALRSFPNVTSDIIIGGALSGKDGHSRRVFVSRTRIFSKVIFQTEKNFTFSKLSVMMLLR